MGGEDMRRGCVVVDGGWFDSGRALAVVIYFLTTYPIT